MCDQVGVAVSGTNLEILRRNKINRDVVLKTILGSLD
jgi:hypothetical protein